METVASSAPENAESSSQANSTIKNGRKHWRLSKWSRTLGRWNPLRSKNRSDENPPGGWDSTDSGIDFEATEGLPEGSRPTIDYSVEAQIKIPLYVQVHWYEWMLYELEACIEDFKQQHSVVLFGPFGTSTRGTMGPLRLLEGLHVMAKDGRMFEAGASGRVSDYGAAVAFRHLAEHRDEPMSISNLQAALDLPLWLKDYARAEKFDHVYKTLVSYFSTEPSPDSATSNAPDAEEREEEFNSAWDLISTTPSFADPQVALLYTVIDRLKRTSFNWAQHRNPSLFPSDQRLYKSYEPKYWCYSYRPSLCCAQTEAAKRAFPDPKGDLLRDTFERVKEIRNHFTHRNGDGFLEVGTCCGRGNDGIGAAFWGFMRAAVKLALLLGDLDGAWTIDVLVQAYVTGRSDAEVRGQFVREEISDFGRGLLGGGASRQKIIARWFSSDARSNQEMRKKWISADLLIEGEEQWRDSLSACFRAAAAAATGPPSSSTTAEPARVITFANFVDGGMDFDDVGPVDSFFNVGGEAEGTLIDRDQCLKDSSPMNRDNDEEEGEEQEEEDLDAIYGKIPRHRVVMWAFRWWSFRVQASIDRKIPQRLRKAPTPPQWDFERTDERWD